MPQAIGELLIRARGLLQDERSGVPPRYSDAKLVGYLNLALADAKRLRPDLFIPDFATTEYDFDDSDTGLAELFPLDYAYTTPFVEYMAGMVSLEEDEHVTDGRAAALLARFAAKLVGKVM